MNTPSVRASSYLRTIQKCLADIVETQQANVDAAARLLFEKVRDDKLIHVFGVAGHSYVGSEEFFCRAGGLANINPLFEASLHLANGGLKTTMLERTEGIGDKIIQTHRLDRDDLLIITSAYGMNACTIDAALEAKRRGCKVIAITSVEFSKNTPPEFVARHSSAKNLYEIADVAIDNFIPMGEVVVSLPGLAQKTGGTCNILQCFVVNWLVTETVQLCLDHNVKPPIWQSYNVVGGDEFNQWLLDKYIPRVKAL